MVFRAKPWVGGGDGKILPPAWLEDMPSEGEGGRLFLFKSVKVLKADYIIS